MRVRTRANGTGNSTEGLLTDVSVLISACGEYSASVITINGI